MKIILSVVIAFQILNPLFAYEVDQIKSGDDLEKIAKRNLDRVGIKYGEDLKIYAEDIKKWNPNITDWSNPPKNDQIYVDFPYAPHLSGSSWAPALEKASDFDEFNQKLSLNAFYASSFGNYTETTAEQEITSGQNFPVTFGLAFSLTNEEKVHFFNGSFYWAQASKGEIKDSADATESTSVNIPGEIGGNLYYQRYFKDQQIGVYGGYDYEKLNTFNTDEILVGSPVENVKNDLHYATVGSQKSFTLFDVKQNFKASVSYVLDSSTTGNTALTGFKYILYYTIKPEGRFSFSAFYKHHQLQGPTDLSIDRIGLSVGFMIF